MKINWLLLILLCSPHSIYGQIEPCECCSYTSLKFKIDYEPLFPHNKIQNGNIHSVTVFTQGTDLPSKEKTARYREMKFNFGNKGQVVSRTEYNREGNPSLYEFERNSSGNIVKQTFTYLDSLEQKNTDFPSEITDYTYDSRNRLAKSKERDVKGNVLADEKSDYSAFAYDGKDRLIKEIRQYYYPGAGPETSVYTTTFKYVDDKLTGESQVYENKRLFLTTKLKYDRTWRLLREDGYNNLTNHPSNKTIYQYDSMGRLVYYATSGSASECPDGGTYNEAYEYDDKGLLLQVTHSYGDELCVMTFEYN